MNTDLSKLRMRWIDLPIDRPMALIERQRVRGEQAMIARVVLHRGFRLPSHFHENEQFAIVLQGRVKFGLGKPGSSEHCEIEMSGGEVLHLPSNLPHSADAIEDTTILDVFSPPSETTGIDRK